MHGTTKNLSATTAVCVGTLALASAMGIGRFSLTPIMPLMQQDLGLTLPSHAFDSLRWAIRAPTEIRRSHVRITSIETSRHGQPSS